MVLKATPGKKYGFVHNSISRPILGTWLQVSGSFRAQEEIGFCTFLSKVFHGFPGYIEASFPIQLKKVYTLASNLASGRMTLKNVVTTLHPTFSDRRKPILIDQSPILLVLNHGEPYAIYPKHSSHPNDITVFCCPSHSSFISGGGFLNLTGGVLGTDSCVPLTGVGGIHPPNWMVHVTAICDVTHLLWRTLAMGFLWLSITYTKLHGLTLAMRKNRGQAVPGQKKQGHVIYPSNQVGSLSIWKL